MSVQIWCQLTPLKHTIADFYYYYYYLGSIAQHIIFSVKYLGFWGHTKAQQQREMKHESDNCTLNSTKEKLEFPKLNMSKTFDSNWTFSGL